MLVHPSLPLSCAIRWSRAAERHGWAAPVQSTAHLRPTFYFVRMTSCVCGVGDMWGRFSHVHFLHGFSETVRSFVYPPPLRSPSRKPSPARTLSPSAGLFLVKKLARQVARPSALVCLLSWRRPCRPKPEPSMVARPLRASSSSILPRTRFQMRNDLCSAHAVGFGTSTSG